MDATDLVVEAEELSPEMEDLLNGHTAGEQFAARHIMEKINMFLQEYRRNGYSESFLSGFIDGINDVTGGAIVLGGDEDEESVETEPESVVE